jgi:hypothetical protein
MFSRNEQANSYLLVEKNLSAFKAKVLPQVRKIHGLTVSVEYEKYQQPILEYYGG